MLRSGEWADNCRLEVFRILKKLITLKPNFKDIMTEKANDSQDISIQYETTGSCRNRSAL